MRGEAQFLFDILDCAAAIQTFAHGKTLLDFQTDDQFRSAVLMKLFIIGEAVAHLSGATTDGYPEIPWQTIKAFRNFIAHHYFRLRNDILWDSATMRVPELAAKVEEILRNEFPGAEPEHH